MDHRDLQAKLSQIEEQLQLAIDEYPNKLALDRLKFATALSRFVRTQLHIEQMEQRTIPGWDQSNVRPLRDGN